MSEFKTGIDIVENKRIRQAVISHKDRFLKRIYNSSEIEYCENKVNRFENYSGFFAAKESVLKAFGTGISHGLTLKDIEIAHYESGSPYVLLHLKSQEFFENSGFKEIKLSISHEKNFSVAVALVY